MLINIINYELGMNNGILSKYANKMFSELQKLGEDVYITQKPDLKADIRHHINYLPYSYTPFHNTLMITHIFEGYKLEKLREAMKTASIGICFSDDTKDWLIERGLDKEKLTTILPAHDQFPRRKLKVLIVTNVYPDNCKREEMFYAIPHNEDIKYTIMGKGWKQADYPEFNYEIYKKLLQENDYLLYFGKDEGAMSVLDAKQVGLKVIAPNIGFHKDLEIDYPFDTQEELNQILKNLTHNPVGDWTWSRYVLEHKKVWENIVNSTKKK